MNASTSTFFPIIAHYVLSVTSAEVRKAECLAKKILHENRRLSLPDAFRKLVPKSLPPAPSLHIDDLSGIPFLDRFHGVTYLEERARLRAVDGDVVASCTPRSKSYEQYCGQVLNLGAVKWLHPTPRHSPLATATACWYDRNARKQIRAAASAWGTFYVHPHQGVFPIWALALLLDRSCDASVKVIGPHPMLCDAVNDKVWFTDVAQRLFGTRATPRSETAWNLAAAANVARLLASSAKVVVVKIPDSAGGAGNLLFSADELLRHSLGTVRKLMRERLDVIGMDGAARFLVSSWETDVLSSPSSQLWIPPESEGDPVVEAVLDQLVEGEEGVWYGSRQPTFGREVLQNIVNRSWLMGRLFQRLGYVGRCSFDWLLVGKDLDRCRAEFVECNGRWGGASVPMTLMNRLFGDWNNQPYVHRNCLMPGLSGLTFENLLSFFAGDVFDATSGRGSLLFLNPTAMQEASRIDVVALGRTGKEAAEIARAIPARLGECIASHTTNP